MDFKWTYMSYAIYRTLNKEFGIMKPDGTTDAIPGTVLHFYKGFAPEKKDVNIVGTRQLI